MAIAYAGPLSRWFGRGDAAEAARLVPGVERWREDLRAGVADKVSAQLYWDEGADVACEADLDTSGWDALRLFALYAEHSELEWPDTVPPLLELDSAWRGDSEQKFARSLYGQLLACELWLPGEFPVTVRAPRPDGENVEIGSLTVLDDQLQWLNQRTFQADAETVRSWRQLPAPREGDFVAAARRGFAGLSQAVAAARSAGLPLLVAAPTGG